MRLAELVHTLDKHPTTNNQGHPVLRLRKACFNVHVSVQNTDNLNRIGKSLTVINHMAASIQFSVANSNIAAILPFERVVGQLLKRNVQHL